MGSNTTAFFYWGARGLAILLSLIFTAIACFSIFYLVIGVWELLKLDKLNEDETQAYIEASYALLLVLFISVIGLIIFGRFAFELWRGEAHPLSDRVAGSPQGSGGGSDETSDQERFGHGLSTTMTRLHMGIRRSLRTAFLNLTFGCVVAIIGVAYFVLTIFDREIPDYLPPAVMAGFIEATAVLFVVNYRLAMRDIRFFENEVKELECRLFALNYSCRHDRSDIEQFVLKSFVTNENRQMPSATTDNHEDHADEEKPKSEAELLEQLLADVLRRFRNRKG